MALRREDASDDELHSGSDEADVFSDSDASDHEHAVLETEGAAITALTDATSNLHIQADPALPSNHHPLHSGVEADAAEGDESDLEAAFERAAIVAHGGDGAEDSYDESEDDNDEDLGEVFSGGDGSVGTVDSDVSAGSEVDLGAVKTDAVAAPEAANMEQALVPLPDKSEQSQREVPVGKFWLHDDRTTEDANNRRAAPRKKIWDPLDDKKWAHDKFDVPSEEDDYQGFLGRGRGRGRGGGRGRGRDQDEPYTNHRRQYLIPAGEWQQGGNNDWQEGGPSNGWEQGNGVRKGSGRSTDHSNARGAVSRDDVVPPPGYENVRPVPKSSQKLSSERHEQEEEWPALHGGGQSTLQAQGASVSHPGADYSNGTGNFAQSRGQTTVLNPQSGWSAAGPQSQGASWDHLLSGDDTQTAGTTSHINTLTGHWSDVDEESPSKDSRSGQQAGSRFTGSHVQEQSMNNTHYRAQEAHPQNLRTVANQGGSLNFNAREWTGNAQSLGDHGGASHLDARAQEFVPPGFKASDAHQGSGQSAPLSANVPLDRQSARGQATYQVYDSNTAASQPYQVGQSGAAYSVYQPSQSAQSVYPAQSFQAGSEVSFVPGPMQNQNWASAGAQGYRGQARRPVTIAAPHDQQSTYQSSSQGGGRRYSTMKNRGQ